MARNPALLYVYASCFGSQGPWAHKAGFHSSPNAIAGAGVVESGDQNPPRNRTYGDPTAALGTATAIMAGVLACRARRKGPRSWRPPCSPPPPTPWPSGAFRHSGAQAPVVDAGQYGYHAYQRLYETADGWLVLDVHTEPERRALATVLRTELPDEPTTEAAGRLEKLFREDTAEAWETRLLAAGVPAAQADRGDFLHNMLNDDHMRQSGVAVETNQPGLGDYWRAGPTMQFSSAPIPLAPALPLGWATASILEELGFDTSEINRLHDSGVTKPIGHGLPD